MRILHIAPELGLARFLSARTDGYESGDIDSSNFNGLPNFRQFDLGRDASTLSKDQYDLIIHNHVLEHIECNFTAVLFHIQRALKPDGVHIFSIPFEGHYYEESLAPLSNEDRHRRFGQWDHVRTFGTSDLARTLGMVIKLPQSINLELEFSSYQLETAGIPREAWTTDSKHYVFVLQKSDMLLRDL